MTDAAWSRRHLLAAGIGVASTAWALPASAQDAVLLGEPEPFSFERLIEQARTIASQPYAAPAPAPDWVSQITPEQQRLIRVRAERALALGSSAFQLRPIHRGGFYREPVRIHLVERGLARELLYDPRMFDLAGVQPLPGDGLAGTGFAGLRIFFPTAPDVAHQELVVFLGASYFRAVPPGARFGISARGLALETGLGRPEEFPIFTHFWLLPMPEQPDTLTICALMQSRSVTGAYRIFVMPREACVMQVDASLFFRSDAQQVGIAPLTSMFYFGPNDRVGIDDYRLRVHNSGGLSIWRGTGEVLWRPLVNPAELRISAFMEENPRGFGLLQRHRDLGDFGDLDQRFDRRPNLWVEPKGAWGRGSVRLIEIPTQGETHDNIVAFWTPAEPARAGSEIRLAYSLSWSLSSPLETGLAPVLATSLGSGGGPDEDKRSPAIRRIAIDFGPAFVQSPDTSAPTEVVLDCADNVCSPPILTPHPGTGGWRVLFDARLQGEAIELRCYLTQGGRPISETWLYRLDKS